METTVPFRLASLHVQHFKGIKSLFIDDLSQEAQWIFLTGENGFGKTSILQALGLASNSETPLWSSQINTTDVSLEVYWHSYGKRTGRANSMGNIVGDLDFQIPVASYGSSRLDIYSESSRRASDPIQNLFDSTSLLENIEIQLRNDYLRKGKIEQFHSRFEGVSKVLTKLMNLHSIRLDESHSDIPVYYVEQDEEGNPYPERRFHELASGMRNIIAMVGDMMIKLYRQQPQVYRPEDLHGMVIIDEVDLHLHPKWQRNFPSLLSEVFPHVQFVASTHSPIPLLGAPPHSVFLRVNRSAEEGITVTRLEEAEENIKNWLPNTILSSPIFGLQEILPVQHSKNDTLRTESHFDELAVSDWMQNQLRTVDEDLKAEMAAYVKARKNS